MGRVGIEDDDINPCRRIGRSVFARHCPGGTRRERHEWQPPQGLVAGVDIFVPNRIEYLMPFVGSENDDLVAFGDIRHKAVGRRDHTDASIPTGDGSEVRYTVIDWSESRIVLAQCECRDGEVDMVEAKLFDGGFSQMHVRDGGRIKGAGVHRSAR